MNKPTDAYGELLWDSYNGDWQPEIIERDDGSIFIGEDKGRVYFSKYKAWPKFERDAIKYAKGSVLDVGCGAGRHSLYLQRKGLNVTGIDNSPLAIKVCKLRGLKKARLLSVESLHRFNANSFDTVLMLGNNFGLLSNFHKAKILLKKLHRITTEKSLIIAASRDPHTTNDPLHIAYNRFNRKRGRMPGQLRIRIRHKNKIGNWFDYLLVSKTELEKILNSTGWKVQRYINARKGLYIAIIKKELKKLK